MAKYLGVLLFIVTGLQMFSQKRCSMEEYVNKQASEDIFLKEKLEQVEMFTRQSVNSTGNTQRVNGLPEIITIPVVFHVLYHTPDQIIDRTVIDRLMVALNRDFNKKNADTSNIPSPKYLSDKEIFFKAFPVFRSIFINLVWPT